MEYPLKEVPFNKIRMCILPKDIFWREVPDPPYFRFKRTGEKTWDFYTFDTKYFQRQEKRIHQLMELGIECDLILFHPYEYDRWDLVKMGPEESDFYLDFVIARLGAFRNIWWEHGGVLILP